MAQEKGTWRLDIIIMVLYQITLIFSAQLIFVIFLDYMPPTYCTEENYCYKLKSRCLTDYDPNLDNICPKTLGEKRRSCIVDTKKVFFYSAQYQYQQDCTDLKLFDLSTATFIGTLIGNIVLGILADKYGRRLIYFFSVLFGIPCLILSASIENIPAFYVFRVLVGFCISGTLTVGWTYATEMIAPNKRLRLLALANWPNARMIQVGLAYLAQEWKRTTYISASITCFALPILWYLPESPIWLEQNDKYEEASKARKRCEKISGGAASDLHAPVQLITFEKVTPGRIFENKELRTSFIVIVFMYFYVGMAVYITDLNGADMTRNLYWGQFLSGLVLSVAQFIIGMSEPCLTGLGRRILFLGSQLIALVCYILIVVCLYSDSKGSILYISAYTVAYASQSICLESAYLALVELMPTDVRATAGSVANIAMKIGTLIASLTKPLKFAYEPALFFINIVLGTIGMIVVFTFLEESRDTDMKMVGQIPKGTIIITDDDWTPPADVAITPAAGTPVGTPTTPVTPMTPDGKEVVKSGEIGKLKQTKKEPVKQETEKKISPNSIKSKDDTSKARKITTSGSLEIATSPLPPRSPTTEKNGEDNPTIKDSIRTTKSTKKTNGSSREKTKANEEDKSAVTIELDEEPKVNLDASDRQRTFSSYDNVSDLI